MQFYPLLAVFRGCKLYTSSGGQQQLGESWLRTRIRSFGRRKVRGDKNHTGQSGVVGGVYFSVVVSELISRSHLVLYC